MDDAQQAGRYQRGGILGLLGLIEDHRAAFTYDWRTRFACSIDTVGGSMSYGEALSLARTLAETPGSHVHAAMTQWRYPFSRSEQLVADLFDLEHKVAAGKRTPKPYPRPWDRKTRVLGKGTSLTPEEFHRRWAEG